MMRNTLCLIVVFALAVEALGQGCYSPTGWSGHDPCNLCPAPDDTGSYCTTYGWTACYSSQQACETAAGTGGGSGGSTTCYAMSGWSAADSCVSCAGAVSANQCTTSGYTVCFSTLAECQAANPSAPTSAPAPPTTKPTTRPTPPTVAPTVPTTPPTTKPPTAPTVPTRPPTQPTRPPTQPTQAPITAPTTQGGNNGGNTPIDASCWKASCADPSKISVKRPTYKGLNCYAAQSKYPQFGPNWTPSGKTAFEKIVPTVQDFYRFVQGPWPAPIIPGYDQCSATILLYESFVCAQEFLAVLNKDFDPTPSGTARKASEFLNHADASVNQLELAAFIAHNWKETGVYNAFEENTPAAYADANAAYPPVDGVTYHGRGVMQISWNYNYGPFSEYIFGNKNPLLYQPDNVDPFGPMGIISAIWFWMNPHDFSGNYNGGAGGSVAPHDAIAHWSDGGMSKLYNTNKYDNVVGFGLTTNIINGGIECTGDTSGHRARVGYFLSIYERISGKNPLKADMASCQADKICKGLFAGCGSSFYTATYSKKPGSCSTFTYV